jgi:hypothetical protein
VERSTWLELLVTQPAGRRSERRQIIEPQRRYRQTTNEIQQRGEGTIMNPTNLKLAFGATLTGLLLIAAGSVAAVGSVAADGPEIQTPGELTVSAAPAGAAISPTDLIVSVTGQPGATYFVYDCRLGSQSDQIINPELHCSTVAATELTLDASGHTDRLISFDSAPTVDGVMVVNAENPLDTASFSMTALQTVSTPR